MVFFVGENNFENGFDESSDILKRKGLYDQIMRVADVSFDGSLVLALDDKWGNGKTAFVKMMESEINNKPNDKFSAIYFDAFENDYQNDPFISLSSMIYSILEGNKHVPKKIIDSLLIASKKLGASFLINGSKFAISSLTSGVVNGTVLDKASDEISNSISSPLEKYIEDRIKSSSIEKENIEKFKSSLDKIIEHQNKKIIFIIDELDRARPDYSLDLLEKIKHVFCVKGIVFILVMSRTQFEKTIECRYGQIDSRIYLNKFIHYWFSLPKNRCHHDENFNNDASTIYNYLINIDSTRNIFSRNGYLINSLVYLLDVNNCSLREAERCYSILAAIDNNKIITEERTGKIQVCYSLVAFLKVHNELILGRILNREITCESVFKELNIRSSIQCNSSVMDVLSCILAVISYYLLSDSELKEKRKNKDAIVADIEGNQGFVDGRWTFMHSVANSVENMHVK